jgi:hypothetical protein
VSGCDLEAEASPLRKIWPTRGCRAMEGGGGVRGGEGGILGRLHEQSLVQSCVSSCFGTDKYHI